MKRLVITALFLAIGLSIQAQNQRVERENRYHYIIK